jgi:hypothetical protein
MSKVSMCVILLVDIVFESYVSPSSVIYEDWSMRRSNLGFENFIYRKSDGNISIFELMKVIRLGNVDIISMNQSKSSAGISKLLKHTFFNQMHPYIALNSYPQARGSSSKDAKPLLIFVSNVKSMRVP